MLHWKQKGRKCETHLIQPKTNLCGLPRYCQYKQICSPSRLPHQNLGSLSPHVKFNTGETSARNTKTGLGAISPGQQSLHQTRCSLSAGLDTPSILDWKLQTYMKHVPLWPFLRGIRPQWCNTAVTPSFTERVVLLLLLLLQHHHEPQSSPVTARGTYRHEEEVPVNRSHKKKSIHNLQWGQHEAIFIKRWLALTRDIYLTGTHRGLPGTLVRT